MKTHDQPGSHVSITRLPAHTASDASSIHPILRVPDDKGIVVESVEIHYLNAVTGGNTNTHHVNVLTRSSAFAAVAEIAQKDFTLNVNAAAGSVEELLSAEVEVAAGLFLAVQLEEIGNGGNVALGTLTVMAKWRYL